MSQKAPSVTHWRVSLAPGVHRAGCDSRISLSTSKDKSRIDCQKCRAIVGLAPLQKRKPRRRINGVGLNEQGLTNRQALVMLADMGFPRQASR